MNLFSRIIILISCFCIINIPVSAQSTTSSKGLKQTTTPIVKKKTSSPAKLDTLIIVARLTEIPGKFAPNDLYNYVYIMKYRILKVVKGTYKSQDILIGHYNPLIPRSNIKDEMKKYVSGNVTKFEIGTKHKLLLIKPIESIWKDAVEDEYIDSESDKYFALTADIVQ